MFSAPFFVWLHSVPRSTNTHMSLWLAVRVSRPEADRKDDRRASFVSPLGSKCLLWLHKKSHVRSSSIPLSPPALHARFSFLRQVTGRRTSWLRTFVEEQKQNQPHTHTSVSITDQTSLCSLAPGCPG